jgi:hypothetical protein
LFFCCCLGSKRVAEPAENIFVDPAEYERKQKEEESERLQKEINEGSERK